MEEKDALTLLKAKDFRSISKENILSAMSSLKDMDKEVAMECIRQFPYYKEYAETVTNGYNSLCKEFLHDNELPLIEIDAHQRVIDICEERIRQCGEEMTHDEYLDIITIISDEVDKIRDCVERHQTKKFNVVRLASAVSGLAVVAGGAILGVKFDKLPFNKS